MFFITLFIFYNVKICPFVVNYGNSEASTKINNYINYKISKIIKDEKFNINDITNINYNKNNQVSAVNIETTKVNYIKSKINLSVQNSVQKDTFVYVEFPALNVFNSVFLTGYGPNIKLKIKINASVVTDVRSEFKSTGINQTIHRVVLDINNNACVFMPMFKKDVSYKTSVVLSETVIVGEVPNSYTEVNDFEDGKIADYIANYAGE